MNLVCRSSFLLAGSREETFPYITDFYSQHGRISRFSHGSTGDRLHRDHGHAHGAHVQVERLRIRVALELHHALAPAAGDLGGAFDTFNFRAGASDLGIPGVLSDAQDADDENNFAADAVSGFNVNRLNSEVGMPVMKTSVT